jgi:hypothetical protein
MLANLTLTRVRNVFEEDTSHPRLRLSSPCCVVECRVRFADASGAVSGSTSSNDGRTGTKPPAE